MEQRGKRPRPNEEGPSGRGERTDKERPEWQTRVHRVKNDEKSPLIPSQVTPDDIDISVRVQLKTLTAENAEMVARHLAMVSLLIDDDPALAHKHALAASRRAGRLAIVHETLGLTAYASGEFALAIRELLTHRRLSGSNDQLPLIVDSERGLGRPERALEAVVGIDRSKLATGVRINLAIALSGARLDLGQAKLAVQELEIPELNPKRVFEQSPLLFRSYAESLREAGSDGDKWDDLALRAEKAMDEEGEEVFQLFEEISIPTSEDFERTAKPAGAFSKTDRKFTSGDRKFTARDGGSSRPDRSTRSDRPDRFDGAASSGRPDRSDRTDRPSRPDSKRSDSPERSDGAASSSRPDRPDRPSRPDRPDRPSRPDRQDRPSRPDAKRSDRPDRPSRPDAKRSDRPDRPSRPDAKRSDRPDRPSRPDSKRPDFKRSDNKGRGPRGAGK